MSLQRVALYGLWALAVAGCSEHNLPAEPAALGEQPAPVAASTPTAGWIAKAPLGRPRYGVSIGVVKNSSSHPVLYAIGGDEVIGYDTSLVEAYDVATDQWAAKAPLPKHLRRTNGVGQIGGKLYISGGYGYFAGPEPFLFAYDPSRNQWKRLKDMPRPVAEGVTGVIGGQLYVLTGICGVECKHAVTRRLYRYDPPTDTWTTLPWAPHAHVAGAAAVIDGKFYVAGGRETVVYTVGPQVQYLDVYDPATNRWTTKASLPTPRSLVAGAVLGGKFYVIGGVNSSETVGTVEAYDPIRNRWSSSEPLITPRWGLGAVRVSQDGFPSRIFAVGGIGLPAGVSTNESYAK